MSLRLRLAAPRLIRPSRAQETARSDVLVVLQLVLLLLARSASRGGLKLIVYSHVPSRLVSHHPIQPIPTGTAIYSSSSSILSHPCERLTRQFGTGLATPFRTFYNLEHVAENRPKFELWTLA